MGCRRAPRQCSSILAKPRCHRTTSVFVVARACACACSRRHHGRLIAAETNIAALLKTFFVLAAVTRQPSNCSTFALVLVACPARARLLGAPSPWAGRFVVTNTSWTKRSFLLTPGSCFFHNGCRQFAILSQRFGSGRRQHCCGIGQRRPSRLVDLAHRHGAVADIFHVSHAWCAKMRCGSSITNQGDATKQARRQEHHGQDWLHRQALELPRKP